MKNYFFLLMASFLTLPSSVQALQENPQSKTSISLKTYSVAEDDNVLKLFEGLRVADGDGVVVVPREQAEAVAQAREILDSDKAGRRRLYERLGMPLAKTVQ